MTTTPTPARRPPRTRTRAMPTTPAAATPRRSRSTRRRPGLDVTCPANVTYTGSAHIAVHGERHRRRRPRPVAHRRLFEQRWSGNRVCLRVLRGRCQPQRELGRQDVPGSLFDQFVLGIARAQRAFADQHRWTRTSSSRAAPFPPSSGFAMRRATPIGSGVVSDLQADQDHDRHDVERRQRSRRSARLLTLLPLVVERPAMDLQHQHEVAAEEQDLHLPGIPDRHDLLRLRVRLEVAPTPPQPPKAGPRARPW